MRVLELYCGIGGCAAALPPGWRVVRAVDQDRRALAVYRRNYPDHRVSAANLVASAWRELGQEKADLWWLSPPCRPFTRRGSKRDAQDPRSASLLLFIELLPVLRPPRLALENVPGFAGSEVHRRLRAALDGAGYRVAEHELCPSELGWPNRRRRWYLTAALPETGPAPAPVDRTHLAARSLAALIDPQADRDETLLLDPATARAYRHPVHAVDRDDPTAVTLCFTSAYGRSPVRSGSYLRLPDGCLRRFSPTEVVRLLGFPPSFTWPESMGRRPRWDLAGNSLSLPVVRRVLGTFGTVPVGGKLRA